jgi:hypothetical protein
MFSFNVKRRALLETCILAPHSDQLLCGESIILAAVKELKNGHVISRQQRDVNRPPEPSLKLLAVAPRAPFDRQADVRPV